jgi:hypothetical protein
MFILTGEMTRLQMYFCRLILNLAAIMPVKVTLRRLLWKVISSQKILQRQTFSFFPSQLQGCGMTVELV